MPANYQTRIQNHISQNGLLYPLDLAFVGATGVGKSSTINLLFGSEVAKVGFGVEPETMENSSYKVNDYFRIHDTAGLGDGLIQDQRHARNITDLLLETCTINNGEKRYHLIDMAMVILDGSSRDLGTTYQLLEEVILRCIEPERVVVAINQADMAMKGRHWNNTLKQPDPILLDFLNEKSLSVKERIRSATGIQIRPPVCYSAYYRYNLDLLMDRIILSIPKVRRAIR